MNPEQLIEFGVKVGLDLIAWFKTRQAAGQELPTDEEVIARVKAKITAGDVEFEAFKNEGDV
jgi:hypothetical protein